MIQRLMISLLLSIFMLIQTTWGDFADRIALSNGLTELPCPNPTSNSPYLGSSSQIFTKRQFGGSYSFDSQVPGFTIGLWARLEYDSFWNKNFPSVSSQPSSPYLFYFASDLYLCKNTQLNSFNSLNICLSLFSNPCLTIPNNIIVLFVFQENFTSSSLLAISLSDSLTNATTTVKLESFSNFISFNTSISLINRWAYYAASLNLLDGTLELGIFINGLTPIIKQLTQSNLSSNSASFLPLVVLSQFPNAGIIKNKTPFGRLACAQTQNFYLFKSTTLSNNQATLIGLSQIEDSKILANFLLLAKKPLTDQSQKDISGRQYSQLTCISGWSKDEETIFDPIFSRLEDNGEYFYPILAPRKFFSLEFIQFQLHSLSLIFDYYTQKPLFDILIQSQSISALNYRLLQISQIPTNSTTDSTVLLNISILGVNATIPTPIPTQQHNSISIQIICQPYLNSNSTVITANINNIISIITLDTICFSLQNNRKIFIGTPDDITKDPSYFKVIYNFILLKGNNFQTIQSNSYSVANTIIRHCDLLINQDTQLPQCVRCQKEFVLLNNKCKKQEDCSVVLSDDVSISPSVAASVQQIGHTCLASCLNGLTMTFDQYCQYQLQPIPQIILGQIYLDSNNSTFTVQFNSQYLSIPQIFIALSSISHDNSTNESINLISIQQYNFTLSAENLTVSSFDIGFNDQSNRNLTSIGVSYIIAPSDSETIEMNVFNLADLSTNNLTQYRVNFKQPKLYIANVTLSVLSYATSNSNSSDSNQSLYLWYEVVSVDYQGFWLTVSGLDGNDSGIIQLSYLAYEGRQYQQDNDFSDITNDESHWGVVPPVRTTRHLMNRISIDTTSIDPQIQPFTVITGIISNTPTSTDISTPSNSGWLNAIQVNSTQLAGRISIEYKQMNYSSIKRFRTDTVILADICSVVACVTNAPDLTIQRNVIQFNNIQQIINNSSNNSNTNIFQITQHVSFSSFFDSIPQVFLSLGELSSQTEAVSYEFIAVNISYDGFDVILTVKKSIKLDSISVNYFATTNLNYQVISIDLQGQLTNQQFTSQELTVQFPSQLPNIPQSVIISVYSLEANQLIFGGVAHAITQTQVNLTLSQNYINQSELQITQYKISILAIFQLGNNNGSSSTQLSMLDLPLPDYITQSTFEAPVITLIPHIETQCSYQNVTNTDSTNNNTTNTTNTTTDSTSSNSTTATTDTISNNSTSTINDTTSTSNTTTDNTNSTTLTTRRNRNRRNLQTTDSSTNTTDTTTTTTNSGSDTSASFTNTTDTSTTTTNSTDTSTTSTGSDASTNSTNTTSTNDTSTTTTTSPPPPTQILVCENITIYETIIDEITPSYLTDRWISVPLPQVNYQIGQLPYFSINSIFAGQGTSNNLNSSNQTDFRISFEVLPLIESLTSVNYSISLNLERNYLQQLSVSAFIPDGFSCPQNCQSCNAANQCIQCSDSNRQLPDCNSCKTGYIEDTSSISTVQSSSQSAQLTCLACFDGCCKKSPSDSLCQLCSDPSLSLDLNCQCPSNAIHLYVSWRQSIFLNITLTNGGDADQFQVLGCNTCSVSKSNRTIIISYSGVSDTTMGVYSSLSNSLGNIEYEVSIIQQPPSYLCYGGIKAEKTYMVGLISTDKSKDHLSNSISLCSDRKTYSGDADSFTKNQSTTLNWQKTYKLRNTANGLVLTDISAAVDLFTATINLTYLHPIIAGDNQPFYSKICQVFKLAKLGKYQGLKQGIYGVISNSSNVSSVTSSSRVQLFTSLYSSSESAIISGWFKLDSPTSTNINTVSYGLLQLRSEDNNVYISLSCSLNSIYLSYSNPPDTQYSALNTQAFASTIGLFNQWIYISLEWTNTLWESTLIISISTSRDNDQGLSSFKIKTAQFIYQSSFFNIDVNYQNSLLNTVSFTGKYQDISISTAFDRVINGQVTINPGTQVSSLSSSSLISSPAFLVNNSEITQDTFQKIVFYYEFTAYDFSTISFMKDFSQNNNNFIDDTFLAAVEYKTGLKVAQKKAFNFPLTAYYQSISEEYGFAVGFTIIINQNANKFEGQIIRVGYLQVKLLIPNEIIQKTSTPQMRYYLLVLCIEEVECVQTKNIRIPTNSTSPYGITIQVKRKYVGSRRALFVSVFGENADDKDLMFLDASASTGFRSFDDQVNSLQMRIGSNNNDFQDPSNFFYIRRIILQSGSYVKPSDLLVQNTQDSAQLDTIASTTLSANILKLKRLQTQKCLLQLGKGDCKFCVKCAANFENILGNCVSNGECGTYTEKSPYETTNTNGQKAYYFDYISKRCAPCNSNCGTCQYSADNCLTCSYGYIEAPKCKQCPYIGSTPTYYNPDTSGCVVTCPDTYCTDKQNLVCGKCDQKIRKIFEDFNSAANSYRGDTWVVTSNTNSVSSSSNTNTVFTLPKTLSCYVKNYQLTFFGGAGSLTGTSVLTKSITQIPLHYQIQVSFLLLISKHSEVSPSNPADILSNSLLLVLDKSQNISASSIGTSLTLQSLTIEQIELNSRLCQSMNSSSIFNVSLTVTHMKAASSISIQFSNLNSPPNFFWGIRLFQFSIKQCHYSCLTCSDDSSTSCLSCPSDLIFVNGQCLCQNDNQFISKLNSCWSNPCYECKLCAYPCGVCDSNGKCLQCISSFFLYNSLCYSDCTVISNSKTPLTGDKSKGLCVPTDTTETLKLLSSSSSPPATFYYAKSWATTNISPPLLLQCSSDNFMGPLTTSAILSKTITFLQPFYSISVSFDSVLLNNFQQYASLGVSADQTMILNSTSSDLAGNQQFQTISTCPTNATLLMISSQNIPFSKNNFNLVFSSNNLTAPAGFAIRNIIVTSSVCPAYCRSCTSKTQCTSCVDNGVLDVQRNICKCPTGFIYGMDWQCNSQPCGKCIPCDSSCLRCSGPGPFKCSACMVGFKRLGVRCVKDCPDNFYEDSLSNSCQPCHSSCYSCIGPKINECLSCYAPLVLTRNTCKDTCDIDGQTYDQFNRICDFSSFPSQTINLFNSADSFIQTNLNLIIISADYVNSQIKQFKCGKIDQTLFVGVLKSSISLNLINIQRHSSLSITFDIQTNLTTNITLSTSLSFLPSDSRKRLIQVNPSNIMGTTSNSCVFQTTTFIIDSFAPNFQASLPLQIISSSAPFAIKNLSINTFICHPSCLTCTGASMFQCSSCIDGAVLNSDGKCACTQLDTFLIFIPGSQSRPIRSQCSKCVYPCTSCFAQDNFSCLSCEQGYYLKDYSCVSSCPPLKYQQLEDQGICQKCTAPCDECTSDGSYCITCLPGYVLSVRRTCTLSCDAMQYADSSGVCQQCHPSCLSCQGSTFSDCILCASGYFRDPVTNTCQTCHNLCVECTDATNYSCSLCQFGIIHVDGSICTSDCSEIPGTYAANGKCLQCNSLCKKCDGPEFLNCLQCQDGFAFVNSLCVPCSETCTVCFGNTSDTCTACADGYYLQGTSCVKQCSVGYFGIDRICQQCDESCSVCYGGSSNQCFSCNSGFYFINNTCQPCNSLCSSCFGPSPSQCFNCSPGNFLLETQCFNESPGCPNGYFGDKQSRKCQQCDSTCLKCEGGSQFLCTACDIGSYLLRISYDINNKLQPSSCVKCPSTCTSCSNSSTCFACINGFFLSAGKCVTTCPSGSYPNISTGTCSACPIQCSTCEGTNLIGSSIVCSSCQDGFYLSSDYQCLKCSDGCILCNSASMCLKCLSGMQNYKNTCVKQCPMQYYPSSTQTCVRCIQPCTTCTSPQVCQSCQKGYYLSSSNSAQSSNISGIVLSPLMVSCQKCHSVCDDCLAGTSADCISCKFPLFLQDGLCQQSCNIGYYGDGGVCYPCPSTCSSCISSSVCSSCVERYVNVLGECLPCNEKCSSCFGLSDQECSECLAPYSLFQSSCVLQCPVSFFKDTSASTGLRCKPCDISCLDCNGPKDNQCISCRKSLYLSSQNQCLYCSPGCLTCEKQSDSCTSCSSGQYLFNSACPTACPDQYYGDNSTNTCQQCVSPCKTCNGSSKNQCNTCVDEYFYSNSICEPCHEDCSSCYGVSSNECNTCKPGIQKQLNSCISCGDGNYFDVSQNQCQTCNSACKTCYGGSLSNCLSCGSGRYLSPTGECLICTSSCSDCTTKTLCTSCVNGYFLLKVTATLQLCLNACPTGMILGSDSQTCNCSKNCAQCSLLSTNSNYSNISTNQIIESNSQSLQSTDFSVTCNKCVSSNYALNRIDTNNFSQCMLNNECTGYINVLTSECINACPSSVPFINDINKQCFSGPCPNNTVLYPISSTQSTCLANCPVNFYANSQNTCQPCHQLCSKCNGPNANQCTACSSNNILLHPVITTCALTCQIGYSYKPSTNTCEICQTFCKACVQWLVLLGGSCLEECPVGYTQTQAQKCIESSTEVVKITSQIGSTVSINKDISLFASISAQGAISSIEWILKKSSDSEFTKAFGLLNINSIQLTIPFLALKPSQTYQIRVEVTLASKDVLNNEITFTTAGDIAHGNFVATPQNGEAGQDLFTFSIDKWKYPKNLFFDLSYYILELQYQMVQASDGSLTQQSSPDFIKKGLTQIYSMQKLDQTKTNTVNYIFPMNFISDQNIACELKVYDGEGLVESYAYQIVNVAQSKATNNELLKLADKTDLLNLLLNLKSLYSIDESKLLALAQSQSQNIQIALSRKKKYSANASCDSSIDCFGQGTCLLSQGIYSCSCLKGFLGQNCEWLESDYVQLSSIIPQIEVQLSSTVNLMPALTYAQIASQLVYYSSFLSSVDNIASLFIDTVGPAVRQPLLPLDQVHLQIFSSSCSGITVTLQQESNQDHLQGLQTLVSDIEEIIAKNMNMGEALTQHSSSSDSLAKPISLQNLDDTSSSATPSGRRRRARRLSQFGRILAKASSSKAIPLVFGELTVDIPPEVISTSKKVVVSATSFKKDPRSNPMAITSTLSLSLGGDSGKQSVQDAPKPFILTIPKKVPSPAGSNPDAVACTYYDESTNSYKTDGCTFVKETITNIICSCTHLTDFSAALLPEQIKVAVSLSDMKDAQAKGNAAIALRLPKAIQITSLPTPKIGQRNVNLVNAVNIQISGGVYNVLAKQVFIVASDGDGTNVTYSMYQFLEAESLDGLIAKAAEAKQEVAEESTPNIPLGQYLVLAFSMFFLLFKIGNRVSIKTEFVDEQEALPEQVLNDLHKEHANDNLDMYQTPDQEEKDKKNKIQRNDNEYENSIVSLTQNRRNNNAMKQGGAGIEESTPDNYKSQMITSSRKSVTQGGINQAKKTQVLKKRYEQEKKIQQLIERVKTIEDSSDEMAQSQQARKQSLENPEENAKLQQFIRKHTKNTSIIPRQPENSESSKNKSPTKKQGTKKTFFEKVDIITNTEHLIQPESPMNDAPNSTDREETIEEVVLTTGNDEEDGILMLKKNQSQNERFQDDINKLASSNTMESKNEFMKNSMSSMNQQNPNLKQFKTNLPSRFKQAAANPTSINNNPNEIKGITESTQKRTSRGEQNLFLKLKITETMQMSQNNSVAFAQSPAMNFVQQKTLSLKKSSTTSETEDVEKQLAVLRMRENIDKQEQCITSKNINPLYSIFKAKETLFQTKASRLLYVFLTMYGFLAYDCLLYKWIGTFAPEQAFVNYLFTYNPIRIAVITVLSNFTSHLLLGFVNHGFSTFLRSLQYEEITIQSLNNLRARHISYFLSVFATLYVLYSYLICTFAQTKFLEVGQIQEIVLEVVAAQILDSLVFDLILVLIHMFFIDLLPDEMPLKINYEMFQSQRGFFYTKRTEHPKVLDLIL